MLSFNEKLDKALCELRLESKESIKEGHWVVATGDYPGLVPSLRGKLKKPRRNSFLLHPDDRSKFIKWSKGTKLDADYLSPVQ